MLSSQLCLTLRDSVDCTACQAPLSMEFSTQDYWNGLPLPIPGDFPNPVLELATPALAGGVFATEPPGVAQIYVGVVQFLYCSVFLEE